MQRVAAMILAGGEGKRMGVLCRKTPKPVLPFAGKLHVVDFSLSNCLNSRIKNLGILTDFQRANVANYLRGWASKQTDADHLELSILEPRNCHYKGTADAVYQNLEYLHNNNVDTVLVLAADHVYHMDYRQLLDLHEQKQAEITMGIIPMPLDELRRFGTVRVNSQARITDFTEKSDIPRSNLVSMGIYAFNVEALCRYLYEDARNVDSRHDFGYSIIPKIVAGDCAYAFQFNGYWRDIGTPEAYYEANMEYLSSESIQVPYSSWPILTFGNNEINMHKVFPDDHVHNSLVGPGCIIKGRVQNSILSQGVIVEKHAVVKNSILMDNVFVADHSHVESCIIGQRATISQSCHIGEPDYSLSLPEHITVLGEDEVVPPNFIINHHRVTRQDNRVSEFAGDMISLPSVSPAFNS